MLEVKQTANAVKSGVQASAILAAQLTAGNLLNQRIFQMAVPHMPVGAKVFLNNPAGKALLANAFAAGLIHFVPTNEKAISAANLMIQSATVELVGTLNIEAMVNDFLDGITLPGNTEPVTETGNPGPLDLSKDFGTDEVG